MTNSKLTIESEDRLLGLIDKFTSKKAEEKNEFSIDDGLSDIYFYEDVNFDFLSESRLKEFIDKFDPNEMTVPLWNKIRKCFTFSMKEPEQKPSKSNEREGNGFYRHIQIKQYAENIVVGGCDDNHQRQV